MFCETKPTNPEFLDTSKMDIVLSPGDFEGRNVQRGIRYSCLGSMGQLQPAAVGIINQFTTLSEERGDLAVVTAAMISWIRCVGGEYCVVNCSPFVLVMEDDPDQNFFWDWGCLT